MVLHGTVSFLSLLTCHSNVVVIKTFSSCFKLSFIYVVSVYYSTREAVYRETQSSSDSITFNPLFTLFKFVSSSCTGHISAHDAIGDYTHVHYVLPLHKFLFFCCLLARPATASIKDMVTIAQKNYTNQTADVIRRRLSTASFGLSNSFTGVRPLQTK